MDAFTKDDLKSLLDNETGWCVSIFLPTRRAGPETEQNAIRLKNLLQKAEEALVSRDMRRPDAQTLLADARALLRDAMFWRQQSDGLAVFVSPTLTSFYRMPVSFEELVVVNRDFHLKPLLPFLAGDGRFYLLALSQKSVRLLEGTRDSISEIEAESLPPSLAEALRYEQVERHLQWHTSTAEPSASATRPAMFHGQGGPEEDAKSRILRYFHVLDEGLRGVIAGQNVPLVLAGVEYLFPIYREANSYPHLLEKGIPGNPEELSAQELHRRAWELVGPYHDRAREEALGKYQSLLGTGLASADPREVVAGAYYGRVESLFFAVNCHIWGTFDPQSGEVVLTSGPEGEGVEDLSDLATIHTILNQGDAYPASQEDMPEACALAAVFRY